jgi:polysaccharide export outer membrane protein
MPSLMMQRYWQRSDAMKTLRQATSLPERSPCWQLILDRLSDELDNHRKKTLSDCFIGQLDTIRILGLAVVVTALGCQQAQYDTKSLPPQFVAQRTVDVSALDLSPLGLPGIDSNQIQAGDAIEVVVATGNENGKPQTWPLRVEQDGFVDVPLVGSVNVKGLDPQAAQMAIRNASIERGIFRRPSVVVNFKERRTNRVTVMGAVEEPGVYELPLAGSSLLDAITMAGGLADDADMVVEVRQTHGLPPPIKGPLQREDDTRIAGASYDSTIGPNHISGGHAPLSIHQINLVTAAAGQPIPERRLNDGALVTVKRRSARVVRVLGLVKNPSQIELPPNKDIRLLDAIAEAGGLRTSIANKVLVIRQIPGSFQPVVVKASIRQAKKDGAANLLLADGDVVSIEETPITFIIGTIQNFVRLGVSTTLF